MTTQKLPEGWDKDRLQTVIAHYECQTEHEALQEDEASLQDADQALVEIPIALLPMVRELIRDMKRERKRDFGSELTDYVVSVQG